MASYPVGGAGALEIYDDGNAVHFFVHCSSSQTNTGAYTWYGTVNGAAVGGTVALPAGFGTRHLGSWAVGYTQTVSIGQYDTGTQGLGGAAGPFYQAVYRATVPGAPGPIGLDEITPTSMRYRFQGFSDGGSQILEWQLEYSTNNFVTWVSQVSSGTSTVTGLAPATTYAFRARGRNAVGWGPYSSVISARTLSAMYVGKGSSFIPAASVGVGKGTAFTDPQIFIGKGGGFVSPA